METTQARAFTPGRVVVVGLIVAVVPGRGYLRFGPDDAIRLEGGPGKTNMKFSKASRLADNHDVLLVGYRGVEGSSVLDCPEVESLLRRPRTRPALPASPLGRMKASLKGQIFVRFPRSMGNPLDRDHRPAGLLMAC